MALRKRKFSSEIVKTKTIAEHQNESFQEASQLISTISPRFPFPFIVKSEGYSFRDFLKISREEGKWEILEGEIIMHSPASFEHEEIVVRIAAELSKKLSDIGKVFGSNAVYRLSQKTGLEPDVSFVRKDRLHLTRRSYFQGPPDIAVEVISHSTQKYDTQEKLPLYKKAGVPLIIYVFSDEKKVVVWEKKEEEKEEKKAETEYRKMKFSEKQKGELSFLGRYIYVLKFLA